VSLPKAIKLAPPSRLPEVLRWVFSSLFSSLADRDLRITGAEFVPNLLPGPAAAARGGYASLRNAVRSDTRTVTAFVLSDLIATDAVRAHEPSLQ
jgi:hypothetical protein